MQCLRRGKLKKLMLKENVARILLKLRGKITIIKDKRLYLLNLIEETKVKGPNKKQDKTTTQNNMARITTYAIDAAISGKDKLVGSDAEDSNITKNYLIADLANYIGTSNTGAQGPEGPAGSNGTNGSDGANGTNGSNGTNGTNGTDGTQGAAGADSRAEGCVRDLRWRRGHRLRVVYRDRHRPAWRSR